MKIGKIQRDQRVLWVEIVDSGRARPLQGEPQWDLADRSADGGLFPGVVPSSESEFPFEPHELLPPVRDNAKIICIGKNYADHAAEMGGATPELPIVFSKFSTALNAPFGDVILPAISQQVDYEAELVVVIGQTCKNVDRDQARRAIGGYMCGNDVSSRDWQKGRPGGQWLVGKSFDTFAPVGPWLTTVDEIADATALEVRLTCNGELRQFGCTRDLIYPEDYLVSYLSQFFTLSPGDLIFTGTPAGVGAGRNPPVFLQPGDVTEISITGLGTLRNRYISAVDLRRN